MPELALAFLLDLWIGDPVYAWHPVRLMGSVILRAESFLRARISNLRLAGALLALGFPLGVFMLTWTLIVVVGRVHFLLGWLLNLYGIYASLSIKDMHQEAIRIYADLNKNHLERARRHLARIVGRDTQHLDEPEIIRATVESVADSTLDGIAAPLFFAAIGGAPLALAYKAVNTLDSMIGHHDERYREFGFFAARQDEAWNLLPAGCCLVAVALGCFAVTGRVLEAFYTAWHHGVTGGSGVSAIPMATFAGALGVELGGTNCYHGRKVERPKLGFPVKGFDREDILKSLAVMKAAAWIFLVFAILLRYPMILCVKLMFS